MPSLDEQIEARRKQAKARKIECKAETIARALGTEHPYSDDRNTEGSRNIYQGNGFYIETAFFHVREADGDLAGGGTTIKFNGEEVFNEGGGTIYSYKPGKWEEALNLVYRGAIPVSERKAREYEARADAEKIMTEKQIRAKWGL